MTRFVKPTIDTKFHIDFDWWEKEGRNMRLYLLGHLCPECSASKPDVMSGSTADWVDPETGEVKKVDDLWYVIRSHCSQHPFYKDEQLPLTTSIFRVFIANDNVPLTPTELYERIGRKGPETILGVIGGRQSFQGIRPVTYPRVKKLQG